MCASVLFLGFDGTFKLSTVDLSDFPHISIILSDLLRFYLLNTHPHTHTHTHIYIYIYIYIYI